MSRHSAASQSEGELDPRVLIRIFAGFGWSQKFAYNLFGRRRSDRPEAQPDPPGCYLCRREFCPGMLLRYSTRHTVRFHEGNVYIFMHAFTSVRDSRNGWMQCNLTKNDENS
jgi:hypothetical protein